MAINIDLENNTKIINFFKSLLDMRIKKLLIISYIFAISTYFIFSLVWIFIGIWYNKYYTKRLLQDGYLPKENDEYSIALLKEYKYLEYTEKEKENIEKIELYRDIVKSAKKDEKIKLSFFITYLLIFPIVITLLFYILINYVSDITVIEFLKKFDIDTDF